MNQFKRPSLSAILVLSGFLSVGLAGWIGSRLASSQKLEIVFSLLLFVGVSGFAIGAIANASRARRPWIVGLAGLDSFVWAFLMIAVSLTSAAKIPTLVSGTSAGLLWVWVLSDRPPSGRDQPIPSPGGSNKGG